MSFENEEFLPAILFAAFALVYFLSIAFTRGAYAAMSGEDPKPMSLANFALVFLIWGCASFGLLLRFSGKQAFLIYVLSLLLALVLDSILVCHHSPHKK